MKKISFAIAAIGFCLLTGLQAAPHKLLFFTKSSGFEHTVISWKKGKPSHAEKSLLEIGKDKGWEFEFSKDGSKFSPEYLSQFDAVIFYTTGNLMQPGNDKEPPMTAGGKQALLDYVKGGKGFVGLHCATDTFHSKGKPEEGEDPCAGHGDGVDPYICLIGGEFIVHGAQQVATNKVINPEFPGFKNAGDSFSFMEEWYALKNFREDLHCLTVIDSPKMKGAMYDRPPYPTTWARKEGDGRVFYTAMGHREDIWTNETYREILVGAIQWATGEAKAEVPPNISEVAPGAMTTPAKGAKKNR